MFKENVKYSMKSKETRQLPPKCYGEQAELGPRSQTGQSLNFTPDLLGEIKGWGRLFSLVQQEGAMLEVGGSLNQGAVSGSSAPTLFLLPDTSC